MTGFEKVMSVLTGLYVLLTAFYAWTSHRTLKAIKEQGKSNAEQFTKQIAEAKKAADAALLNAQAVVQSERAWVLEQIKFPAKLEAQKGNCSSWEKSQPLIPT